MKSLTMNMMLAAAALMAGSTAVSAQTMKAEIPFAFKAHGKVMPAGQYNVYRAKDETSFTIRNAQSHESVMLLALAGEDAAKGWDSRNGGLLQFVCSEGCTLQRIWTHQGYPVHELAPRKPVEGKSTRLAVIRLVVDKTK
jgi:hypothetical protein